MKQTNTLPPTSFFHLWRLCIPTLRPIQRAHAASPYDIFTHQTNKDTPTEEAIRRLEINHHAIFQSRNEFEAQINEARARAKQFATERTSEQPTYLKALHNERRQQRQAKCYDKGGYGELLGI